MVTIRTEQHQIKRRDSLWKVVDENCFFSKNLYNYANYYIRQEFINNGNWIRYNELDKILHVSDPYKELMSQPAQQTLAILDKNWKSFFTAIKDWKKYPEKYLGRPRPPKYLPKDGRYVWSIKNNTCYVKDGVLHFQVKRLHGVTFPVRTDGRLLCVRFIPHGSHYTMEVIFEVEVPNIPTTPMERVAGIDLGVDNLVTMSNNIGQSPIIIKGGRIKAINQFYNKSKAQMQSELKRRNDKNWSKSLGILTMKRNNRIKTYLHATSRWIADYCVGNGIDTLICGLNKEWKQNCKMNTINSQKFCYIPHDTLIWQLRYKCENVGIRFVLTEEAYTSGTSFLDGELPVKEKYNKSRRVKRGLFKSGAGLVNADVNGAYQIIKKVFPEAFDGYGIGAECLQPVVISVA